MAAIDFSLYPEGLFSDRNIMFNGDQCMAGGVSFILHPTVFIGIDGTGQAVYVPLMTTVPIDDPINPTGYLLRYVTQHPYLSHAYNEHYRRVDGTPVVVLPQSSGGLVR